jgi:hypothetical protein
LVLLTSMLKRMERLLIFLREKSVKRKLIAIFRRNPLPNASSAPRKVFIRQEDSCLQKEVRYLSMSYASWGAGMNVSSARSIEDFTIKLESIYYLII